MPNLDRGGRLYGPDSHLVRDPVSGEWRAVPGRMELGVTRDGVLVEVSIVYDADKGRKEGKAHD